MVLVNWAFLLYTDIKKILFSETAGQILKKNSQESGFDISRRPDCPVRAVIATGKLP